MVLRVVLRVRDAQSGDVGFDPGRPCAGAARRALRLRVSRPVRRLAPIAVVPRRRARAATTARCGAEGACARAQLAPTAFNTNGYSSTYLAMGFADVRAGTRHPPEH